MCDEKGGLKDKCEVKGVKKGWAMKDKENRGEGES